MNEWKEYHFKDLFEIPLKNGLNKPSKVRGEGFRMVNMKEIFGYNFIGDDTPMELVPLEEKEKLFLQFGDLLFARQSLVASGAGKVSYFRGFQPTVFESHLIRCRINPNISNSLFLYYLIKSPYGRGKIETIVEQTAAAGIRGSDLKELIFKIPSLPTQTAIAEILSSLDDKIELNNKINQELETLAQTLFKQWFIDFEFPNENGEPYKSSGGEMVDSKLGEIPKGWTAQLLSEATKLIRGISYRKPELVSKGEGIAFVNLKCFSINGTFRQDGIKYYNGKFKDEHILQVNDILVAVTDLTQDREIIGMPILWNGKTKALPSLDTCIIRSETSELKNFLYYEFKTKRYKSRIIEHANGSTVLHLSVKGLETYVFPLPNDEILKKWYGIIQHILETINSNINEIYDLSSTRNTLLPKLISGELELTETPN